MRVLLAVLLVGIVGCGGSSPPAQTADAAPVAALEKIGAKIKRDEQGEVVEVELNFNDITDAGLVHLKGLKLTSLTIPTQARTDLGLKHYLAALETHTALNLVGWKITDAGLVHLTGLANLKKLVLYRTQITDAGLVHLKGLTKLQTLELPVLITDPGLIHLKGQTGLQKLYLGQTQINLYKYYLEGIMNPIKIYINTLNVSI